jgi:hypothetical protein
MTREPNPNQIPMTKAQIPEKTIAPVIFLGLWVLVLGI